MSETSSAIGDSRGKPESPSRRSKKFAVTRLAPNQSMLGLGLPENKDVILKRIYRPYSDAIASEIRDRVAYGESLKRICDYSDHLPDYQTVTKWLLEKPAFGAIISKAREIQAIALVDAMREAVSQNPERHPLTGAIDPASVALMRLRLETAQWLACRMNRQAFGDKMQMDHGGSISINVVTGVPRLTDADYVAQSGDEITR